MGTRPFVTQGGSWLITKLHGKASPAPTGGWTKVNTGITGEEERDGKLPEASPAPSGKTPQRESVSQE